MVYLAFIFPEREILFELIYHDLLWSIILGQNARQTASEAASPPPALHGCLQLVLQSSIQSTMTRTDSASPEVHTVSHNGSDLVSSCRMELWMCKSTPCGTYVYISKLDLHVSSIRSPSTFRSFIYSFIHLLTHLFIHSFICTVIQWKYVEFSGVFFLFILTVDFCILCFYSKTIKNNKICWLIQTIINVCSNLCFEQIKMNTIQH